jgi:hypothetical protein
MRNIEKRHYRLSSRISGARAYIYNTSAVVCFLVWCAGLVFLKAGAAASQLARPAAAVTVASAGISLFNYPNPFDSRITATRIIINRPGAIAASSAFSVTIYDLFGLPVRNYGRVERDEVVWDGRDDDGRYVSRGGYICVVSTAEGRIAALRKIGVIH